MVEVVETTEMGEEGRLGVMVEVLEVEAGLLAD